MKSFAVSLSALALFIASLITQQPAAIAQDDVKKVKLRWYGQSMFQLETAGGKSIVFDPQMMPVFAPPRLSADITLISHPHNDHNQVEILKEKGRVFEGVKTKGKTTEWNAIDEKVGAIRLRTLGTYHDAVNGMQRGKSSVWMVEVDGLRFAHLGDLGHELTAEQIKVIGKVDVLMIPIGGIYTLNGEQAKKVVEQLKPRLYVIPMHYGVPGFDDILGPTEFLGEFEKKEIRRTPDTNELVIPVEMKADAPTVVVLGWKAPEKKEPEKKEPEKKEPEKKP